MLFINYKLQPLVALLSKEDIKKDLQGSLFDIFNHIYKREYTQANAVYLKLAIGNAPWPMGVTNIGIHERGAR